MKSLKRLIGFCILGGLLISSDMSFAQTVLSEGRPTGGQGFIAYANFLAQRNPNMDMLFVDLRANTTEDILRNAVGSPYLDKSFRPCKVYMDDELYGSFIYRYNAYNDEVEVKSSIENDQVLSLNIERNIILIDNLNNNLSFLTFKTPKKGFRNGYLNLLVEGDDYRLYKRTKMKFTEGKKPVNSMVREIPPKFSPFIEYYFFKKNSKSGKYIETNKSKFLAEFDAEVQKDLKTFMKDNKINLKKEEDLKKLFAHLNS